ncbi:hypothetical protein O6H91_13G061800 [Diphasiastrum complanatum]|uniref:Uncharacterized protein n=1 Tax=Diphasiastrum complanatum TaxID=34168 RepID=A0ACC2BVK8_DIPCM|nr:hypothetical protein O6H91_13G061800 [Diphasiastrum complanatum]
MSFTVALVDFYNTHALSTKFPVYLMALFVLVSAAGALLQFSARCRWRIYSLRQRSTSFVDVEEALDETEESVQTENEKGRLLPKCNHRFHTGCIDMWFHTHSTCPLCRTCVGVEESLYFYRYLDEEIDCSASSTSNTGNGPSLSNLTSEAAQLDQSLLLRAFAFDKHKMTAFLKQQGFRFSSLRQQQPAAAPASNKSVQLPVNVLFCGRETHTTSHVSSNSSAMKVGHLAMGLPQTCPSPSPSWTSTPSIDPPAAQNSLNSIKRILNMKEHRFGAAHAASNFTDCEQGIEAV